ncbi:MAG: GreA/GreB family elongation factor, partial [Planctomycetota bacterium]
FPADYLAVARRYAREVSQRDEEIDKEFAGKLMDAMARPARPDRKDRAEALLAALAVSEAVRLGLPAPEGELRRPIDILNQADRPADLAASLPDDLWPELLETVADEEDAAEQFEKLLYEAPAAHVDDVAERLAAAGREQAVTEAVERTSANPREALELAFWLWDRKAPPTENAPSKSDLLMKLLKAMQELDHDWDVDDEHRKQARQRFRNVMGARNAASFRQALSEMDQSLAAVLLRRLRRSDALSAALRDDLITLLREQFFQLFMEAKTDPWADENAIYTTEAALDARQGELKELIEVKMLENSRAIGAAASHGDLRENSEWKFALEERDMLQARAAKLQEELAKARILRPDDVPTDHVGIGSKVKLARVSDDEPLELTFLGPWESDVSRGIYSYKTQLGQDLMGKTVGDTVTIKMEGKEGEYRIAAIESAM